MNLTFTEKIIYGAIALGIGFPIMGIYITLNNLSLDFSIANLFLIHLKVPAIFLIDLAPIILPLVAWYVTSLAKEESKIAVANDENKNLKRISQAIFSLENPDSKEELNFKGQLKEVSENLNKL